MTKTSPTVTTSADITSLKKTTSCRILVNSAILSNNVDLPRAVVQIVCRSNSFLCSPVQVRPVRDLNYVSAFQHRRLMIGRNVLGAGQTNNLAFKKYIDIFGFKAYNTSEKIDVRRVHGKRV